MIRILILIVYSCIIRLSKQLNSKLNAISLNSKDKYSISNCNNLIFSEPNISKINITTEIKLGNYGKLKFKITPINYNEEIEYRFHLIESYSYEFNKSLTEKEKDQLLNNYGGISVNQSLIKKTDKSFQFDFKGSKIEYPYYDIHIVYKIKKLNYTNIISYMNFEYQYKTLTLLIILISIVVLIIIIVGIIIYSKQKKKTTEPLLIEKDDEIN